MFLTLFLLNAFHVAISECLGLTPFKIEAINSAYLTISIGIVGSGVDRLNGHFSDAHKDCRNKQCGSTTKDLPLAQGQRISVI